MLYLLFHLLTLSSLADPAVFRSKMAGFDTPLFVLLEFILAVPLVFHAFNGTRLILYESFGCRNDTHLLHWLGSLGLVYLLLLGVLMGMGSQSISPSLFGMVLLAIGLVATAYSARKIWWTHNSRLWKIQRLSAAYLLFALLGHMLFMHLNHAAGHQTANILARLQLPVIQVFYLLTVCAVLYHAVYGLSSLIRDLTASPALRILVTLALLLSAAWLTFLGLKLIFFLA